MDEIRLGTIGTGMIVHQILNCVKQTDGIKLEAVYSRSVEKGKKLAAQYGTSKVYTDLDAFLADPYVNFVYIASPNSLHYTQAKAALLAGKNVIIEKPCTPTAAQAAALIELAQARNLLLIDATPTAYLPNLSVLKTHLPEIGKIKLVMSNYSQYSSRYDRVLAGEVPTIFSPEFAGGCLMDINYYNVYLNIALFGTPKKAVYFPNIYPGLTDTSGSIILQYDGFVSQNAGAKDTWGVNFFQIEGEKGFIYVENGANGLKNVRVVTKSSDITYDLQTNTNRWHYAVSGITNAILNSQHEVLTDALCTMLSAISSIECARKDASIFFPSDDGII